MLHFSIKAFKILGLDKSLCANVLLEKLGLHALESHSTLFDKLLKFSTKCIHLGLYQLKDSIFNPQLAC